jgi:hypothetical protein
MIYAPMFMDSRASCTRCARRLFHSDPRLRFIGQMLTTKPPFPELRMDVAVIQAVSQGRRPSRPTSCSGTPSLDGLWNLLQDCWAAQPPMRPTAVQIVERLVGPDIQATAIQAATDWDERFTPRFRRLFLVQRSLPSDVEFERMISDDG